MALGCGAAVGSVHADVYFHALLAVGDALLLDVGETGISCLCRGGPAPAQRLPYYMYSWETKRTRSPFGVSHTTALTVDRRYTTEGNNTDSDMGGVVGSWRGGS